MIEHEKQTTSTTYHQNNLLKNETGVPEHVHFYGMTVFLKRSLEKIKKNTKSEVLKKLIHKHIEEYLFHIKNNHNEHILYENNEIPVEDPSFMLYAKTAYTKVKSEEECLSRLLDTLGKNDFESL